MKKILSRINEFLVIIISISGYVPKNATFIRTLSMGLSLIFLVVISLQKPQNSFWALVYFLFAEGFYFGFIWLVLGQNGLKARFIRIWGEEKAYLIYEGILGFLFFHNGASIGFLASATSPGSVVSADNLDLAITAAFLFIFGFGIKILCTKILSVEIYYWKDMFLGRKIIDFNEKGPYKYFTNPMYGVGQAQAYAVALWYCSSLGAVSAMLNQLLIFWFYFQVEKKFIKKIYS